MSAARARYRCPACQEAALPRGGSNALLLAFNHSISPLSPSLSSIPSSISLSIKYSNRSEVHLEQLVRRLSMADDPTLHHAHAHAHTHTHDEKSHPPPPLLPTEEQPLQSRGRSRRTRKSPRAAVATVAALGCLSLAAWVIVGLKTGFYGLPSGCAEWIRHPLPLPQIQTQIHGKQFHPPSKAAKEGKEREGEDEEGFRWDSVCSLSSHFLCIL